MPTVTFRVLSSVGATKDPPSSSTTMLTSRSASGAGLALSVNETLLPSVTAFPPEILIAGTGSSLSSTVTLAV